MNPPMGVQEAGLTPPPLSFSLPSLSRLIWNLFLAFRAGWCLAGNNLKSLFTCSGAG